MFLGRALLVLAALSQEPAPNPSAGSDQPAPAAPEPAPQTPALVTPPPPGPPAEPPRQRPSAVRVEPTMPASPPAQATQSGTAGEVQRLVKRLGELPSAERSRALEALREEYGGLDSSPLLPPPDLDLGAYLALPPVDQARVTARHFVGALLAADATALLAHCGFPFSLEDLRVDRPEDLRSHWAGALKTRRTDLLALFDLEVLTPSELERKYGPPPRRLAGWPWRSPGWLLVVANLSGRGVVLLLRPAGAAWQVVGYHD